MPTLDSDFASFLAGDWRADTTLYERLKAPLLRQVRRRAADLPMDIAEDAVMEVFALIMEHGAAFDPARGSARAFINAKLVPEAVRRIRSENAGPGAPKRQRKSSRPKMSAPTASLDEAPEMPTVGHGSPEAMEAACDARVIWSWAPHPMRVIIGGLMGGRTQIEIASDLNLDRFKIARMIKTLRQFANAA